MKVAERRVSETLTSNSHWGSARVERFELGSEPTGARSKDSVPVNRPAEPKGLVRAGIEKQALMVNWLKSLP